MALQRVCDPSATHRGALEGLPLFKSRKTTPCTVDETSYFNGLPDPKNRSSARRFASSGKTGLYSHHRQFRVFENDRRCRAGVPLRQSRHCTPAPIPVNEPRTVAGRDPSGRLAAGPVAQWLEPAAHNGLVAGSSPAGPTSLRELRLGKPVPRTPSEANEGCHVEAR